MSDYYFTTNITNTRTLCIGPITQRELEGVAITPKKSDARSYYLFEMDASELGAEIKILAKLVSEEAAFALSKILQQQFRDTPAAA